MFDFECRILPYLYIPQAHKCANYYNHPNCCWWYTYHRGKAHKPDRWWLSVLECNSSPVHTRSMAYKDWQDCHHGPKFLPHKPRTGWQGRHRGPPSRHRTPRRCRCSFGCCHPMKEYRTTAPHKHNRATLVHRPGIALECKWCHRPYSLAHMRRFVLHRIGNNDRQRC